MRVTLLDRLPSHALNTRLQACGVLVVIAAWVPLVASAAFPDARNAPPAGWTGPVFKLSQTYPRNLPSISSPPWLQFDYTEPARAPQYLNAVLNYCMQGNTANRHFSPPGRFSD